jgi:hypothetical protein
LRVFGAGAALALLWKDKNIEEIHKMATEFAMKKNKGI